MDKLDEEILNVARKISTLVSKKEGISNVINKNNTKLEIYLDSSPLFLDDNTNTKIREILKEYYQQRINEIDEELSKYRFSLGILDIT